jgi:hypothetical protein
MANQVDRFIEKVKGAPVLSSIFAAACAISFVAPPVAFATVALAPIGCGVLLAMSGLNLFRDRSTLSKAFSVAAGASATAGLAGVAATSGLPDFGPIAGFFAAAAGMAGASVLDIVAHYTRNSHLNIKASITRKDDSAPTPPPPGNP